MTCATLSALIPSSVERGGKDSIKSRKHPLTNKSFLPAPTLLAAFSHHRTIPGATAALHLQPLFPGLQEDKTQPTLQREQHSKENTFKCQKAMKETDIILRGKKAALIGDQTAKDPEKVTQN